MNPQPGSTASSGSLGDRTWDGPALIARRLARFALGWMATVAIWLTVFALEGRLDAASVLMAAASGVTLAVAVRVAAADPDAPRVLPVTVAACVVLGLAAMAIVAASGVYGEIFAFMLLTLYLAAALVFCWGWRAELVLLVATLGPWAVFLDRFPLFVSRLELGAAVTIGAAVALALAEGTARNRRQVARRRRAQDESAAALAVSRDAYRDLAEHAPDMIWTCDLDGRMGYANEALAHFLGRPVSMIVGRLGSEFWTDHPANPTIGGWIAAAQPADQPIAIQCRTPRGPRWVEVVVSDVMGPDGVPIGFRGVSRDVQERRDAEAALRASEERFRSAFDYATIGMVVVGPDGRPLDVNPAFGEMLGYTRAELLGRTMDSLAHPDDVARATVETMRLVMGEIRAYRMEKRYYHRDGHVVWGRLSCSLTRDAQGQPLHLLAQIEDISERKAAETALRESEARYRSLVESQREWIVRMDLEGRVTFVNDAYLETFGEPRAAVLGRTAFHLVHPDDRAMVEEAFAALTAPPHRVVIECRNLTPAGQRWVAWEGGVVVDGGGRMVEAQAVGRDVTERRLAEDALKESHEKLRLLARRQVMIREEERKRLGFDLHDDVCQELVGVGILIEALRRKLTPMASEHAAEFDRIVRYLAEVVEHLRVLARELRPFLLRDLGLDGSLGSLATGMSTPALAITTDIVTPIPRLDEETETTVYRVAQEALANAVRHAGARTIAVTLAISVSEGTPDDAELGLEVRDDGYGFDSTVRPVMALGLASMEERALALGGHLAIRSVPGEGTTVSLRCPVDLAAAAELRGPGGSSPRRSSSPPSAATTPRAAARD